MFSGFFSNLFMTLRRSGEFRLQTPPPPAASPQDWRLRAGLPPLLLRPGFQISFLESGILGCVHRLCFPGALNACPPAFCAGVCVCVCVWTGLGAVKDVTCTDSHPHDSHLPPDRPSAGCGDSAPFPGLPSPQTPLVTLLSHGEQHSSCPPASPPPPQPDPPPPLAPGHFLPTAMN